MNQLQNVTTLFNNIFNGVNHRVETRIQILRANGTTATFNEDAIISIETSKALFADGTLSFGGCVAKELKLQFYPGNETIPRMAQITVQIRVTNATQQSEWITKGVYFIDTREYNTESGIMTVDGFDAMLKTEQPMIPEGLVPEYPKTMSTVVSEIATAIGVTVDPRNSLENWSIQLPTGYSMREVLGFIAAVHAGNWTITDSNKLRLIRGNTTVDTVPVGQLVQEFTKDNVFDRITHVIINIDDETYIESVAAQDNGRTVEVTCPWAVQAWADRMLAVAAMYTYQPFTASKAIVHPAVELGDALTVNGLSTNLITEDMAYSALYASDISAPAEKVIEHEYPYESGTTTKIERKLTQATTELWVRMNGIQATVTDLSGNLTQVSQTADKINWLVKSGTSASDFTVTDRLVNIVSESIVLTGYVKFNDLSNSGASIINGDNIKTGKIESREDDDDIILMDLDKAIFQVMTNFRSARPAYKAVLDMQGTYIRIGTGSLTATEVTSSVEMHVYDDAYRCGEVVVTNTERNYGVLLWANRYGGEIRVGRLTQSGANVLARFANGTMNVYADCVHFGGASDGLVVYLRNSGGSVSDSSYSAFIVIARPSDSANRCVLVIPSGAYYRYQVADETNWSPIIYSSNSITGNYIDAIYGIR